MSNNSKGVRFFYGTFAGRIFLKIVMKMHLDRVAVSYLWSPLSRPMIRRYIRKNRVAVTPEEQHSFRTFRDMFIRTRKNIEVDDTPGHLISPCDGWLSVFPIDGKSCFSIKNSHYRIEDFLSDKNLSAKYRNGTCMIFRLEASDYHHYCYVDSGKQGKNCVIPGILHSVQPIACEKYPVYVLNRRSWCLLNTDHFGPVVQCEIGALIVGDIVNLKEDSQFCKGEEKGRFELAGSTIVLLFENGKVQLKSELESRLNNSGEVRVIQGQWIASAPESGTCKTE